MNRIHWAMVAAGATAFAAGVFHSNTPNGQDAMAESEWVPVTPESVMPSTLALSGSTAALRWTGETSNQATENRPQWRLVGITDEDQGYALFSDSQSKVLLRLTINETLPDGIRVAAIERDGVVIDDGECRRSLVLYSPTRMSAEAPCIED